MSETIQNPAFGFIGNALKSNAADHIVVVAEDLYDTELGMYQSEINKAALENSGSGSTISSDHYFMTISQYEELVEKGSVVVNGETIVYDENAFYALYEPEE